MKTATKMFALVACVIFCAFSTFAQSDRGSITGRVTDANGAAVANAKVTATNINTNDTRDVTTSDDGNYTLAELKADPYKITVEAQGFKSATQEGLIVAVQVTRRADFKLEVGDITSVVTVAAEDAPVLQADTPVRQTNITERQVRELPLQVTSESGGRTPLAFIFLDSAVTSTGTTGTDASNFRVSGGQSLGTEILIDGAATRRTQKGTFFTEVAPGPNAYQEFTLSTSNYSAEFGNSSGGIVNFTLKSGNNALHGEVYDLWRNDALNANSFLANSQRLRKNRDHRHNFGGNVGGPIYLPRFGEGGKTYYSGKNRAFYFFNFEGYREAIGENVLISVPTARMRVGDFGELLTDPDVLRLNGGAIRIFDSTMPVNSRNAIPNNDLRNYISPVTGRSIIDPVGLNIVQFFPTPNRPGVVRNYTAQTQTPNTVNSPTFKLDFQLTEKQHLSFSYAFRNNTRLAGGAPRFPAPFVRAGVWDQLFKSHFFRLQHDYTLSPTLLNHFNAGYNRFDVANMNTTEGFNELSLGFLPNSFQNKAFPKIDFPGYGDAADPFNPNIVRSYQGIGSTFFSDRLLDNGMQFTDFMTWVHGNQTMKFGADVRSAQFNVHQLLDPGGELNFRANQTANNCCDRLDQGFPIASLLTGATEFSFNSVQNLDPGWRQFSHSYFFQDDIKLTSRLTVNAGIRYDLPGLRYEAHDRFRGFDPNVANPAAGGRSGAIVSAGGGGLQAQYKTLAKPDRSNFGPRVGFAYSWDDKTVVRGGIGLYYAPILYGFGGNNTLTEGTIGYNSPRPANINGGADANPDLFLRSYRSVPGTDPNGQFIGADIDYFGGKDFRTGRTLQYGVDVQRELPYNFVVQLSYTGHRADRLRSDLGRINAIPLNALRLGYELLNKPLSAVTANERAFANSVGTTLPANNNAVFTGFGSNVGQSLKPFPQYGYIRNQLESLGRSWYNAGTVKLDRRFARGIQFGLSYTYSKLITDASEDLFGGSPIGSVLQNPYDRSSLRSVSPNSIPHVFVVNYLLELPFGKGKRWANGGGLVDRLVGGWQFSGINRYQSGLPLVLRRTGQDAFSCAGPTGFCTDVRPNLTGQPILTNNHTLTNGRAQIFNRNAFAAPPSYNQGAPAELIGGALNPAYVSYYANPLVFFGNAPPVLDYARDLPFLSENVNLLKKTRLTETVTMELGAEAFNLFNRHRLTQPGSNLQDFPALGGSSVDAGYGPRVIQLRVRFIY